MSQQLHQSEQPSAVDRERQMAQLRDAAQEVMEIESVTYEKRPPDTIVFRGRLRIDSDSAFATLRPRFEQAGYTPLIERHGERHRVTAMPGIVVVKPSNNLINLVLFILTVITTFLTGALYNAEADFNIVNGLLFSGSILTILGAHELGHYFAARYYHAPVTLPYFIPMPPIISPIGTLGAVIRLKAPFINRKSLFDVGIAGPLAGLVFAVPILLAGLAMSPLGRCNGVCMQEGNSLFYAFAKYLVFGRFLPQDGLDVQLGPVAWAGWIGLLVTALNLLPAGQLDGGHIIFALFGRRAKYFGYGVIVLMALLGLPALLPMPLDLSFLGVPGLYYPGWEGWFVWVALVWLTGVRHPLPLNDASELGAGRKALGAFAILLFLVLFTPLPFLVTQ